MYRWQHPAPPTRTVRPQAAPTEPSPAPAGVPNPSLRASESGAHFPAGRVAGGAFYTR